MGRDDFYCNPQRARQLAARLRAAAKDVSAASVRTAADVGNLDSTIRGPGADRFKSDALTAARHMKDAAGTLESLSQLLGRFAAQAEAMRL